MEEPKQEEQKTFLNNKIFLSAALLLCILLAGSVGYFLGANNANSSTTAQQNTDADVCAPQPTQNADFLSKEEISQKLTTYLNKNFFSAQGITVNILSVENFSNDLYKVKFELKKGDQKLEEGEFYAMKDGKTAFLAMLDLTKKPQTQQNQQAQKQEFKKTPKPKVELYVMSFCPFGKQAERGILPVLKLLKDKIDFELHFIFYENYCQSMLNYYSRQVKDEDWGKTFGKTKEQWLEDCKKEYCLENTNYCSMHGVKEAEEDLRQICIFNKSKEEWIKYVEYFNEHCTLQNLDTCWKEALSKTSITEEEINSCLENKVKLAENEIKLTTSKNVSGSPTMFINGTLYSGSRTPEAYKKAICSAFTEQPEECNKTLSDNAGAAEGSCG